MSLSRRDGEQSICDDNQKSNDSLGASVALTEADAEFSSDHESQLCDSVEENDDRVTSLTLSDPIEDIANDIANILLQKFGWGRKKNLRDGKIERPIHGVQHACRVAIFVKIFCEFYRLLDPENQNLISNREIKILQVVGLLHDAMRENDLKDEWEGKSAAFCKKYLMDLGLRNEEASQFASLILSKEKGGLFGKVFQSADALDIPRVRKIFYIDRMSIYHDAKEKGLQQAVIQIVQSTFPMLAFQYDLGFDVDVYVEGKYLFTYNKNSEAKRALLKAEYEHADNCFEKIINDLEHFPLLDAFYNQNIQAIDPIQFSNYAHACEHIEYENLEETLIHPILYSDFLQSLQLATQDKNEMSIVNFYQYVFQAYEKNPTKNLQIVSQIIKINFPLYWDNRLYFLRFSSPESIVYQENLTEYHFLNLATAETYLFFLKLNDPVFFSKSEIEILDFKNIKRYQLDLTIEQGERIAEWKQSIDTLIKSVRWDSRCFIRDCLKDLTLSPTASSEDKKAIRVKPHKQFTVFGNGYFSYKDRKHRMTPDQFLLFKEQKKNKSQAQSVSLSFDRHQAKAFNPAANKFTKTVVLMMDPKANLANRFLIYSGATYGRFYEFETQKEAFRFFHKMVYQNKRMFPDYDSFKKGILKHPHEVNEAMYYASWNLLTSAIGVAADTFESRCIAQHYAAIALVAVTEQYAVLGKPLPQAYYVPIQFYLPTSPIHLNSYAHAEQQADRKRASHIFESESLFHQKMLENNPEFMLLLNAKQCEALISRTFNQCSILVYLVLKGYFELVDTVYGKTDLSKTKSLSEFLKENVGKSEISFIRKSKIKKIANSPLWAAVQRKRVDLDAVFSHQYAHQDEEGNTVLMVALVKKEKDIALKVCQSPYFGINLQNQDGKSAVFLAIEYEHKQVLNLLLNHPVIDLSLQDQENQTVLMFAVALRDLGLVRYLVLNRQVNVNAQNRKGNTALMMAIHIGDIQMAQSILEAYQTNISLDINVANSEGYHALILATRNGWADMVKQLLSFPNIKLNQLGKEGRVAFFYSLFQADSDIFEQFMQHPGLDINARDFFGNTALMLLAHKGSYDKLDQLVQRPELDPNLYNNDRYTALHFALFNGQKAIAECLLKRPDIDVSIETRDGVSVLQLACQQGYEDLICLIAMKRLQVYEAYLTTSKNQKSNRLHAFLSDSQCNKNKLALVDELKLALLAYPAHGLKQEDQARVLKNQFLKNLLADFPEAMKSVLFRNGLDRGYESQ